MVVRVVRLLGEPLALADLRLPEHFIAIYDCTWAWAEAEAEPRLESSVSQRK